jgi:glycosyltransferase involved in cell wall biosynthesis
MKIAYILPVNMRRFGYSMDNYLQTHFSVEIAREVAKKGHEVELHVFWDENITFTEKNLNIHFYKTDLNVFFHRDFTEISLNLLNKRFSEDTLIHFHEPRRLFFIPFMLKHKNIIITDHHGSGILNPFPRYSLFHLVFLICRGTILRHLLNSCQVHVVHNIQAMNSFNKYVEDKNSILLTPNGINLVNYKEYDKEQIRRKLGLRDEIVILFAGRICKSKGIRELISAFEIAKEQHSKIRLVVAGPLQEKSLKPIIEKYWVGFQNQQELQKWFTASDIFCLPTIGGEGFPIILVEALYHAIPVITTDVPGIKEWLPPDSAIIIPPKDVDSLKNAICDLIDGGKRQKMNKNSRQFVLDNYTWEKICQKYIDVYRSYAETC